MHLAKVACQQVLWKSMQKQTYAKDKNTHVAQTK
jgi:hypothetical protein